MNDEKNSGAKPAGMQHGVKLSAYPRVGVLGKDDLLMVSVHLDNGEYSSAVITFSDLLENIRCPKDIKRYADGPYNHEG